ncbi:MAG: hypothetical protein FWH14_08565 [Oscillospiraceae bacterium]|nr:hypothetical protein [Oscillospiraceae bacterium]
MTERVGRDDRPRSSVIIANGEGMTGWSATMYSYGVKFMIKMSKLILAFVFLAAAVLFFVFFKEITLAAKESVMLCIGVIIPSLFCFVVLSHFAVSTGILDVILSPFGFVARYVFKVSPRFTSLIVMSMIGGYPVGARLLAREIREGNLSAEEGGRMLHFCVNSGPAFVISGIAVPLFGSLRAGVIIYLSQIFACMVMGLITSPKGDIPRKKERRKKRTDYAAALVDSVNASLKSMAMTCGCIIFFSAVLTVLTQTEVVGFLSGLLAAFVSEGDSYTVVIGFFEVASGALRSGSGLMSVAVITAFGGLCVHSQVAAAMRGTRVRLLPFMLMRPVYVAASAIFCRFAFVFTDTEMAVFAPGERVVYEYFTVSPVISILLIILSVILLLFTIKSVRIKIL